MAELLIKIGDGANYSDGDVLCAFSDRAITCVHAQHICHHKRAKRNQSGLLVRDSLTAAFMDRVSQYRFERVSATEIERILLTDGTRERFGAESIDVRLFVRRRKANPNCIMFGEDGREVWYGGRTDFSLPAIAKVWDHIESNSDNRRSDEKHRLWSMGRLDIRSHLAIRTEAMDDDDAQSFTEPQYEVDDAGRFVWKMLSDDGTEKAIGVSDSMDAAPDERNGWKLSTAAKRRRKVNWQRFTAALKSSRREIEDKNIPVGHEHDEPDGKRYTSLSQPLQMKTEVSRKQARIRPINKPRPIR